MSEKRKFSGLAFNIKDKAWMQNGVPVERNGEHLKRSTSQVRITRKHIPTIKAATKK